MPTRWFRIPELSSALIACVLVTECALGGAAQAAGPTGAQPHGSLNGKIVYLHAGHGFTAENEGNGAWTTQRPETFELVEDLGNQDQMTLLAHELWRSGATVVPLRPVGHQPLEVVLDNDDPEVEFVGAWVDSTASVFFGGFGDVPYRSATTSTNETAYARFRPNLTATGFYPVYAWTPGGSDRVEQIYRVSHTGGQTEVRVDHRMVGDGLVYLGTFHFAQGSAGHVDVSNRSDEPGVVIADMIRFGNGMGDINRGGGVSGQAREDEAGLYWVMWHVDRSQGIPDSAYRTSASDRNATVSLAPRWAAFMNRQAAGSLSDRVLFSYHSNAGGGAARGVLGLYNGNNTPSSATPNQLLLAETVAREINDDLVAQAGAFEHNWANRTTVTLDRSDIEFGEINNSYINNEFDATIIETGYHDNMQDAELLRAPKLREALARATAQGLVRYFRTVDAGATPEVFLPAPPISVSAVNNSDATVTVSWDPPAAGGAAWDPPTGYRVNASLDGRGFDGGTPVPVGTSLTLAGHDPGEGVHYFRVVSVNAAGESAPSGVVAATAMPKPASLLIVNGFDRLDRYMNPRQPYFSGEVDRVRARFTNSRDYVAQVAEAVEAYSASLGIDSTDNEAVIDGRVSLGTYDTVVWFLGEESGSDMTFSAAEQSLVAAYIETGGGFIASGAEIGWDLDNLGNGPDFYHNTLGAIYIADDANTYEVMGAPGSLFDGLSIRFDDGAETFDTNFPDVIGPLGGATEVMSYSGGTGGGAAIHKPGQGGEGGVVTLGFPFISIVDADDRAGTMAAMLDCVLGPVCHADLNGDGVLDLGDIQEFVSLFLASDAAADINGDGILDLGDIQAFVGLFLAGC